MVPFFGLFRSSVGLADVLASAVSTSSFACMLDGAVIRPSGHRFLLHLEERINKNKPEAAGG